MKYKLNTLLQMSDVEYFSLDRISASDIRLFTLSQTPAHYKAAKEKMKTSDLMIFGTLVHVLAMQPDKFEENYIVISDDTRRTQKLKNDAGDKTLIKQSELEAAKKCVEHLHENRSASKLFENTFFEQVILFNEPFYGAECKAKIDGINLEKNFIFDIKTTNDISNEGFYKNIFNSNYIFQAAFYKLAAELSYPNRQFDFYFLAVENVEPFYCNVFRLSQLGWSWDRTFAILKKQISRFLDARNRDFRQKYNGIEDIFDFPLWFLEKYDINFK